MLFEEVIGIYTSSTTHRSKQRDTYSIKNLARHFAGRQVADIKRIDVRRYIAGRTADGVQPGTINRELRCFSAAINFVRLEHDRTDLHNPAQRIGLPEPESRVRWITHDQARALIDAAGQHARRPHLRNFVRLALNTGCRRNELLALEWDRVDLDRKILTFEAQHTKGGRRRTVPLNSAAVSALLDQRAWTTQRCPGSRWVFAVSSTARLTTVQKGFKAACARSGIDDFRVHDMRHTCASWLVIAGVSLYVVKDLLGHSSITVTERYAHLSPDQARSAVQLLLPG